MPPRSEGGLANRRVWADFGLSPARDLRELCAAGGIAPDGIALDEDGALWVADCTGVGAHRVRPGGEIVARSPCPEI
ncbi:MAG: SMP-30/gluconolactonase/LRE family protein [Actinobacteria bacterium]|nr:SMP-30/gluconolactonase/LRE family protein [Actinomycetota bacterium]